jgi:hypothetical protein
MDDRSGWLADLAQHSDTAAIVAAHDWASTPLGPPERWPTSLQVATSLCLSSSFPILVAWGDDLIMLYNEGYRAMLGDKHPAAVGTPVRVAWAEVWPSVEPLFDQVRRSGSPYAADNLRLDVQRNGYLEEAYFTFAYSSILEAGEHAGTLNIAVETTGQVVAERRLALLSLLGTSMVEARDVTEVCVAAVAALRDLEDVASAEIRIWVEGQLIPIATSDVGAGRPIPGEVLATVCGTAPAVLDDDWLPDTPARQVAMAVGSRDSTGVLVLTLHPLRPFDEAHRAFVELAGRTVGTALDSAFQRSVELGEQRLIGDTLQAAMLAPASDLPTVAARYVPASGQLSVGGDWYDAIELPDGGRALVVGDCVGHGLAAATAMGQLRSASRALLLDGHPPAEVVRAMDLFARSVPNGDCATMACAVIDLAARTLTYACAGHLPPLLVRAGTARWLEGGRNGPLAFHAGDWTEAQTDVESGDVIVLFTDGLVERRAEIIDRGLDRLRVAVEAHADEPVEAIANALLAELVDERTSDDVVLLVKRVP